MRSSHEDDWASSWDFPTASRMDLSEEEIQNDGEHPEKDIVAYVGHSVCFLVGSILGGMFVDLVFVGGSHGDF